MRVVGRCVKRERERDSLRLLCLPVSLAQLSDHIALRLLACVRPLDWIALAHSMSAQVSALRPMSAPIATERSSFGVVLGSAFLSSVSASNDAHLSVALSLVARSLGPLRGAG